MKKARPCIKIINITGVVILFTAFIMLALFTTGINAIMTAIENINQSKQAVDAAQIYYGLDSDGQILLKYTNSFLSQAEEAAVDYIYNEGYKRRYYEGIPVDLQEYLTVLYEEHTYMADFWDEALNKVYFYKAMKLLSDNQESLYQTISSGKGDGWHSPEVNIMPLSSGNVVSQISISATFYSGGESNLTASLELLPLVYTIYLQDDSVCGERDLSAPHYTIKEWRLWDSGE